MQDSDTTTIDIPDSAKGPDFDKHLAAALGKDPTPPTEPAEEPATGEEGTPPEGSGGDQDGSDEPKLILGKFKTVEDLQKAYQELERKQGTKGPKADPKAIEAKDVIAPADLASFQSEYAQNGALSEESYKALAKKGFSKDLVDDYIATKAQQAKAAVDSVYASVGGEDAARDLMQWAASNLDPEDIEGYNAIISTNDPAKVRTVLKTIKRLHDSTTEKPERVSGRTSTEKAVKPFGSLAEQNKAFRDPKYGKDQEYTRQVQARIAVTDPSRWGP